MLDQTTLFLFSPFEREVAQPTRSPIKGFEQFQNFVDTHNGLTDCYADLFTYPFTGVIDKIYFDFDGVRNGMEEALPYAQIFYRFLTGIKKLSVIPVASGKKGFNLYVILKEQSYPNAKQLLYDVTYSLIVECFGKISQFTYIDKDGREHPTLTKVDENNKPTEIICLDPKIIGDVRRFSRIPNTLRPPENCSYCTYLDPYKFPQMSITDVHKAIKHKNTYAYQLKSYTTLKDIEIHPQLSSLLVNCNGNTKQNVQNPASFNLNLDTSHLEQVLRPCLFKYMLSPEPRHDVRVAATADLIGSGFSNNEIVNMYQKLHWVDFDLSTTQYQVEHCKPICWDKSKLQEKGICFSCGRNCR